VPRGLKKVRTTHQDLHGCEDLEKKGRNPCVVDAQPVKGKKKKRCRGGKAPRRFKKGRSHPKKRRLNSTDKAQTGVVLKEGGGGNQERGKSAG